VRSAAELSLTRLASTLLVAVLGGVQVGLYMADRYDDGVAEPLSLWIGIGILLCAAGLGVLPFLGRGDGAGRGGDRYRDGERGS
jgi:hypothetical protein